MNEDLLPLEQIVALHAEYGELLDHFTHHCDSVVNRPVRERLAEYCDQLARLHEDEAEDRRRLSGLWRREH
ncbi:hypothetical protein [Prauserella cavernicola]|uniref:Uncharacterized protein n=1 Tax=Prauserella cavernicola TaxID=2800127 RepID=A0A934QSM0_9PSEU|nr:hypothetical protein [Prauserella cavernicola]MBK1785580.1 hypothetical protein [Prauserella cavernicola]